MPRREGKGLGRPALTMNGEGRTAQPSETELKLWKCLYPDSWSESESLKVKRARSSQETLAQSVISALPLSESSSQPESANMCFHGPFSVRPSFRPHLINSSESAQAEREGAAVRAVPSINFIARRNI